jgi:hypothetical protein
MFEQTSRYSAIENVTLISENGSRVIIYKKRRFIPAMEKITALQSITIVAGDRLDNISARIFGDPLQYWHICDANDTMHPPKLTDRPGKSIRIPVPGR